MYINTSIQGALKESRNPEHIYKYTASVESTKILNLTGSKLLSTRPFSWGVGVVARAQGYQAISFSSKEPLTVNYAIIDGSVAYHAKQEKLK